MYKYTMLCYHHDSDINGYCNGYLNSVYQTQALTELLMSSKAFAGRPGISACRRCFSAAGAAPRQAPAPRLRHPAQCLKLVKLAGIATLSAIAS